MSSNDFIVEQLSKLSLIPIKHTDTKNHLFADFFELVVLFSEDEVSLNDILNKYRKEDISVPVLKKKNEGEIGSRKPDIDDLEELWADEILQICLEREKILKDQYPFSIDSSIMLLKDNLNDKQKIYILLLFASNLNYFPCFESFLTTDFEHISFQSLKSFMPPHAIIKEFGKNTEYRGTAQERIIALGSDLNVKIFKDEIENNVRGNQERGLDVIGWIPFHDKTPNLVSILGQCACGKDWHKKQSETRRYENSYYQFYRNRPIHTMFIPYALGTGSSSFYQSDEIDCLLFERFRILEYINETDFLNDLASKKIIDDCISHIAN